MSTIPQLERQYAKTQDQLQCAYDEHMAMPSSTTAHKCGGLRKKLDKIRYDINKKLGRTI